MTSQYEFDGRCSEGLKHIQILFARDAEHEFHTLVLQGPDEKIGRFDIYEVGHLLLHCNKVMVLMRMITSGGTDRNHVTQF